MQGKRAHVQEVTLVLTAAKEGEPVNKVISVSQQSYDNLVDHFNSLIELVASHTEYNPNEPALTISGLQNHLSQLKTANNNTVEANVAWSNGRINRDTVLYAEHTGLIDTALNVKSYIKSVFGTTSPQYAEVKGIEFRKKSAE